MVITQVPLHMTAGLIQAGGAHFAPSQVSPEAHALPQPPQFALSVFKSKHVVPHAVRPAGQFVWQTPATHDAPAVHAFPHAPQFAASTCKSRQLSPHLVVPLGHAQELPTQVVPPVHETPHPPQLFGLRVTSTQLPAHSVVLPGHVAWQTPPLHT